MEFIRRKFELLRDITFKKLDREDISEDIPNIDITPIQLNYIEKEIEELFVVKKLSIEEICEEIKVSDNQEINGIIDYVLSSEEEIDTTINLSSNGLEKLNKLKESYPSPVQRTANQFIRESNFRNGIISMATGSGKSLVLLQCASDMLNKIESDINICSRSILIFTERKNILLDLIFTEVEINGKKEWIVDEEKKFILKDIGAIDLDKFNVFEFISNKNPNWNEVLHSPPDVSKTVIIFINRTFLVKERRYEEIILEYSPILILHDEMHSATNFTSFNFLMYAKLNWNSSLIGFSATPIRIGYSAKKDEENLEKISKIFSNWTPESISEPEAHIYMSYPIIKAISDNVCSPIKFKNFAMKVKDGNGKRTRFDLFDSTEFDIIMKVINESIANMPFKKIVAWLSSIKNSTRFNELFIQHKHEYPNLAQIESFVDHSNSTTIDYQTFALKESNAILFCVNKHREGSDILNLDTVVFLDRTIKRGYIVFLQSIGRVTRKARNKQYGLVIEGIYRKETDTNQDIFKEYIKKIVLYYLILDNKKINNISIDEKFDMYYRILQNIHLNEETHSVMINHEENIEPLEVAINQIDWDDFAGQFEHLFQNELLSVLNISPNMKVKLILNRIGKSLNFQINTHFWQEIEELTEEQYKKFDISQEFFKENEKIIENINWFDIMEFDCSTYPQTLNEILSKMDSFFITYSAYEIEEMEIQKIWNYCYENNIMPRACAEYFRKLKIPYNELKFKKILIEKHYEFFPSLYYNQK